MEERAFCFQISAYDDVVSTSRSLLHVVVADIALFTSVPRDTDQNPNNIEGDLPTAFIDMHLAQTMGLVISLLLPVPLLLREAC